MWLKIEIYIILKQMVFPTAKLAYTVIISYIIQIIFVDSSSMHYTETVSYVYNNVTMYKYCMYYKKS